MNDQEKFLTGVPFNDPFTEGWKWRYHPDRQCMYLSRPDCDEKYHCEVEQIDQHGFSVYQYLITEKATERLEFRSLTFVDSII